MQIHCGDAGEAGGDAVSDADVGVALVMGIFSDGFYVYHYDPKFKQRVCFFVNGETKEGKS